MPRLRAAPPKVSVRWKCVWGRSTGLVLLAWSFGFLATVTFAQEPTRLEWDANADPYTVGYRVFGGPESGNYDWTVDVGNATTAALPPLPTEGMYYFVVRAYNAVGALGPPSNEASIDLNPPGAPNGLRAVSTGSQVTLSWQTPPPGPAVARYLLYVGTSPGGSELVSGYDVGRQLTASGSLGLGRYYARVRAANRSGLGPLSPEVSFAIGAPERPGSPSDLTASWQGTVATLRWSAATAAAFYVLEAGTASGASNVGAFPVGSVTSYSVDVPPGTYYVRLRGANGSGLSVPSNEIILRGRGMPEPPTSLIASGTGSAVDLRWTPPTTGASPTGYILEAGDAPGLANLARIQIGPGPTFSTSAPPGTYYIRVRAVNARGASGPSNEIVIQR